MSQMRANRLVAGTIAVVALAGLSACGTVTTIVPDAEGVEHVFAIGMGCNKPYELSQSCSGFSGATRLVEISGFQFKIAGTADGTVVLMMGAKQMSDAWSGRSGETANIAFEVVKKYLVDEGVSITLVEPVSSGALLSGYIVTADGDAYSLLSRHSVED